MEGMTLKYKSTKLIRKERLPLKTAKFNFYVSVDHPVTVLRK